VFIRFGETAAMVAAAKRIRFQCHHTESPMNKHIYTALGWIAVALGMLGVVLPVLPTVPFMILAAAMFAKGSPKARAWLVGHAHFGAHIQRWEETGGISRRGKTMAIGTMAAVFGLAWFFGAPGFVLWIQALCMGPAALFVLTRPDERKDKA